MKNSTKMLVAGFVGAATIVFAPIAGAIPLTVFSRGVDQAPDDYVNHELLAELPSYNLPEDGKTTLVKKCQALKYYQDTNNFFSMIKVSFQVGFEHPDSPDDLDDACLAVRVDTRI